MKLKIKTVGILAAGAAGAIFRWAESSETIPEIPTAQMLTVDGLKKFKLQQLFSEDGNPEWRDVPVEE